MSIIIHNTGKKKELEPICRCENLSNFKLAGESLEKLQKKRILGPCQCSAENKESCGCGKFKINIIDKLWPSENLASSLFTAYQPVIVYSENNEPVAWISENEKKPEKALSVPLDPESLLIKYPWDLLEINEEILKNISENDIQGKISQGVNIDGKVHIGKGSVLLPGVYIEGNLLIGENCKIGPNCYFRANTSLGDNCHIGQAVEIKNSILADNTSIGHLSYLGDSIIGRNTNFGAGTITANFRHDGKNHKSEVGGKLIDTGRRKFGTVIGENVHTGIHTSIYPGRKIWDNIDTFPGEIIKKDKK